jgi:hypothetical protein
MAEIFYGPWQLEATNAESNLRGRFTVIGSDGTDGTYEPNLDGTPLQLSVSGPQWSILVEARTTYEDWFEYTLARASGMTPAGLGVRLASQTLTVPGGGALIFAVQLVIVGVSSDPELTPPSAPFPVPYPYDFTLPEGTRADAYT